jgi:hypothetical protein
LPIFIKKKTLSVSAAVNKLSRNEYERKICGPNFVKVVCEVHWNISVKALAVSIGLQINRIVKHNFKIPVF